MREKNIEQFFRNEVRKNGGLAIKFTSPGFDGMPDRIVLFPGGKIAFVELKAPGKRPKQIQAARHSLLRELGFLVFVIDSKEQAQEVINAVQTA